MKDFILNLTQNELMYYSLALAIITTSFIFYHGIIKSVDGNKTLTNFFKKIFVYVLPGIVVLVWAIVYPTQTVSDYSLEVLKTYQLQGSMLLKVSDSQTELKLKSVNSNTITLQLPVDKKIGNLDCGSISIRKCLDTVKENLTGIVDVAAENNPTR